jgi:asparagine synthase (glutamine-hydrolysing)
MLTGFDQLPSSPGCVERMMYINPMSYLPDDFLVKVDHAAMTVILETPVPMLDHPLVEFAMPLPLGILHAEGQAMASPAVALQICSKGSG